MDFKSLPVILCQLPSQISCLGDTYVENSRIPLLTTTTTYKNPIKSVTWLPIKYLLQEGIHMHKATIENLHCSCIAYDHPLISASLVTVLRSNGITTFPKETIWDFCEQCDIQSNVLIYEIILCISI